MSTAKGPIKLTMDTSGTLIVSGPGGRVIVDADVAREIAEMVAAHRGAIQRSEVLGRLVVGVPALKVALRPGIAPTHEDPKHGRQWHYRTPQGDTLAIFRPWLADLYVVEFVVGQSFERCKGPGTREHTQERIEAMLVADGYEVTDVG